ncbi:glycosyltransferase family 4 protein [Agromyces luteolus]
MSIAYDCVFPVNTGGGERVYRRMAEELVARGAHVTYVTRAQWPPSAPPPAPFDLVSVWRGEIYDDAGVRTTGSAVAFAVGLFRHFVRRRRDVDLVVVAALPVLNVFAVRAALLGRPVVIAVDWLEVWPARKWRTYAGAATGTVAAVLQWLAVRIGDLRLVNSGFTRTRLRAALPGVDPIVLGLLDLAGPPRTSVDPAALDAASRERSGREADTPYVAFVGRHIADKRLEALPPALAVARRAIPGLEARVVGTGPETERVRAAAAAAGVADAVHFLGRLDDDDLDAVVSGAAALVNPSAREGFGLVVAEAAAVGVPSVVVAGDDNASAELVEPGVNGAVATDASPETLGAAIREVVEAGGELRRSTAEWFARERAARNLAGSVDELLRRADRLRR